MIPQLDSIVTVCEHGKKQMLNNGVDSNKITKIYPGIDTDMFDCAKESKESFRRSFQLPKDKFIFITPARMTKYKGIEVLLEAIVNLDNEVRSNTLFWVTTPATRYREDELRYTKEIFQQADSLGVKDNIVVSFSDFSSMPFAYRAADAFVLPSLTEQLPVTILEAMASRLPVISTNVGGVSEVLNNKTGNLVNAGDAKGLSKAMKRVYASSDRQKVDLAVKKVRNDFNLDRMVEEYLSLYKSLIT
jgi:glycosyltransferase involved in cell wall biosynthesis